MNCFNIKIILASSILFLSFDLKAQNNSPSIYWSSLKKNEKIAFINGVYSASAKVKYHHKQEVKKQYNQDPNCCLLYTSPSPRDRTRSRMPSSA